MRTLLLLLVPVALAVGQEEAPPVDPVAREATANEELRKAIDGLTREGTAIAGRREALNRLLEEARTRKAELERSYAEGGLDVPTEDEVLALLRRLEELTDRSEQAALIDRLRSEQARYAELRDATARWLVDLTAEFEVLRQSKDASGEWTRLETERRSLLRTRRQTAADLAFRVGELVGNQARLEEVRRETLFFLRRKNLLLRGRSQITEEALTRGAEDLQRLPGWIAGTAKGIGAYVIDPKHGSDLLRLGGILAAAIVAFLLLGRRLAKRVDREEARTRVATVLARSMRALTLGIAIALVPWLASHLLPGLPEGVRAWLRAMAYLLGGLWLARTLYREMFRPDAPDRAPVKMEAGARRRLGLGMFLIAALSFAFLPLLFGLQYLGYTNRGVIEIGWLVYKTLLAAALLVMLFRRAVLASLLPRAESAIGRLIGLLVRYLRPVVVVLVPTILVLDALRYDILAALLTRYAVAAITVLVAGSLLYRLAQHLLDVGVARLYAPGRSAIEERRIAARDGLHFLLRVLFFFVALSAFLRISGSDMAELERWLDHPLPLLQKTWWNLAVGIFYLVLFLRGTGHAKRALQEFVLARTSLDRGVQYTITTLVGYLLVFTGVYLAVKQVFDLSNLGYLVAALGVGIGFGLQEIISNFVSGLILLFERPLKVGDLIQVGEAEGIVKQVNIRATTVLTRDNVYLLVPNREFIGQTVVNFRHKDPKMRVHVPVGVSYGSDPRLVQQVLRDVGGGHPEVLQRPAPDVWFTGFGDSSLDFELLVWVADPPQRQRIGSELRFTIFDAFREHGIEIPFPQRDVHMKSGPAAPAAGTTADGA